MLFAARVRMFVVLVLATALSNCGSNPGGPSPNLAFALTASPNPIAGVLCTGCGAGSTDREAATTLTIREIGGAAGTVTLITLTLRNTATGAVVAQGELNAAAIAASGSTLVPANGALDVRVGVHYPASEQGRPGTLTCVVRVLDNSGSAVTQQIVVPVSAL
jgi:hypothetical protein